MRQYLPEVIFTAIQSHLREGANSAEGGWEGGNDEEDTLSGDLGANLRCPWSNPVSINEHEWKWRVTYKKFRGRGPDAPEKKWGADGIFQIEVENIETSEITKKGLLFQAKKITNNKRGLLIEQISKMESLAPNGSAIVEYGPEIYSGYNGKSLLNEGKHDPSTKSRLGDYLADRFLGCNIGILGMYYDAKRKIIIVPQGAGQLRSYRIFIDHRIGIEVEVN